MACTKRPFRSAIDAKRANKSVSFRLRVYWCDTCRAYHVSNGEKLKGGVDFNAHREE